MRETDFRNIRKKENKRIYDEWLKRANLMKKIIKSNILTNEESNDLIETYQGYISDFIVGDTEKGFQLGEKLKEEIKI